MKDNVVSPTFVIPDAVRRALEELRRLDGRCHLAGGAVRDTLLGRPVKDWDIFVPADRVSPKACQDAIGGRVLNAEYGPQYFEWSDEVIGTAEHHLGDGVIINAIHLARNANLIDNLNRFDWGICRVGLGPFYNIIYGEGFKDDVADRVFRLRCCKNADQLHYAMQRFNRIHPKYPDWGLVVPTEFGSFIKSAFMTSPEGFDV